MFNQLKKSSKGSSLVENIIALLILSSIIMPTMWLFLKKSILIKHKTEIELSRWFYSVDKSSLKNESLLTINARKYTIRIIENDPITQCYELWKNDTKVWEKTIIH